MTDAVVVAGIEHERFDVEAALWLLFWRRRRWIWIVAVALAFGSFVTPQAGWVAAAFVSLTVLVFGVMLVFFDIRGSAQRGAELLQRGKPFTYRVSAQALEIETPLFEGAARWSWSAWVGAFDDEQVLVVDRHGPPLIIPKRQLPPGALAQLTGILKAALPGRTHFMKESTP